MANPVKVLIVDDSALVRSLLTEILNSDPRLTVVGAAHDPYEARELIKQLKPDVLTLDIEMPKMNGIAFLKNLMRLRPMPVVMISTLTHAGAPETLEALAIGAVDFMPKPKDQGAAGLSQYRDVIISKVCCAATANIQALEIGKAKERVTARVASGKQLKRNFICSIGASTGGTEAIKDVLMGLPKQCPPIVIAQHIPAAFSTSFAERLNNNAAIGVCEAQDGQPIQAGWAYLAPGDKHLKIARSSYGYSCVLDDGPLVNRHKPSVEVLFDSVMRVAGKNAMAVMLTGMGADGSHKMLELKQAGCTTVCQDQASSVVWGMPGVAVEIGAADHVLPLGRVADSIMRESYS
jgi:two-component system chemotaxis response regulator CheB